MRSFFVLVSLLLVAGSLLTPASAAAENCRFILGFKAIYDLIPGTVGTCLENEHYNPLNGDALQRTTNGLLVWRKADNFTAFTDGYRTWVNGPYGIQQRLNTERFPWERDAVRQSTRAEILQYLQWLGQNSEARSSALDILITQISILNINPYIFLTDYSWQKKTSLALATLKTAGMELQQYPYGPVPMDAESLHNILMSIGQDYIYIADEEGAYLASFDIQHLRNAIARMDLLLPKLRQVTDEVRTLSEKYRL